MQSGSISVVRASAIAPQKHLPAKSPLITFMACDSSSNEGVVTHFLCQPATYIHKVQGCLLIYLPYQSVIRCACCRNELFGIQILCQGRLATAITTLHRHVCRQTVHLPALHALLIVATVLVHTNMSVCHLSPAGIS